MGWWRLGFARRGPQHRPARRPGGGQEPRHAGRGRTVGVRRGALVQATRPLGHGGDAAARIRRDGAARCRRGSGARGGAAATGGPAPRRRPGVRRRGPPRCPARGAAPAVFGAELRRERHVPIARVRDTLAVHATPDGAACALYGTGFTELLRLLVGFEGAMLHVSCRATGGAVCEWRAAPPDPRHG